MAKKEIKAWRVRTWQQGRTPRIEDYQNEADARAAYSRAIASRAYMQVHIEPVYGVSP